MENRKQILIIFILLCLLAYVFAAVLKPSEEDTNVLQDKNANPVAKLRALHLPDPFRGIKNEKNKDLAPHVDFFHGFLPTLYVILISELGDKTFFIAAIMSIRNSRCLVYFGAMSALASMTVLSALLGYATTVVPKLLTWLLSGGLFAVFGLKMIKDGYYMSPEEAEEEYNEVKESLRQRETDEDVEKCKVPDVVVPTAPLSSKPSKMQACRRLVTGLCSKVFVEAFILTFLAEWGDRSQISTIILAATQDVVGVIVGGILGHAFCTGLAVIAGRILSQKIPIRWLTLAGGLTFLIFSVHTFYMGPDALH